MTQSSHRSWYLICRRNLAGVDHEEAGEKWRAGDAAKSLRFFVRAIDTYDEGLQRFPEAFDLAYNKWVFRSYQHSVLHSPQMCLKSADPECLEKNTHVCKCFNLGYYGAE